MLYRTFRSSTYSTGGKVSKRTSSMFSFSWCLFSVYDPMRGLASKPIHEARNKRIREISRESGP